MVLSIINIIKIENILYYKLIIKLVLSIGGMWEKVGIKPRYLMILTIINRSYIMVKLKKNI